MEINDDVKEEINVIFHASLLGRTDVLKVSRTDPLGYVESSHRLSALECYCCN